MSFFSKKLKIDGDERQECLAYYQEEKNLRLLYESVEQLFNKGLRKYEDAYFKARKEHREFWSIMEKIFEVREYMSHAATEIVKRKKEMMIPPPVASEMSSAWLAAYSDYEALRDPTNIVASSNFLIVAMQRKKAKELFTNFKKSLRIAWKEENNFRKRLKISAGEYKNIIENAMTIATTNKWLQKLEAECP